MTTESRGRVEDFTAVLDLPASPAMVLALFTSADGVSHWWGPTEGDADVGGTLVVSFGDNGVNTVRVLEVGPTRVVWESVAPPTDDDRGAGSRKPTWHTREWLGTTMEFDITPTATGTQLRFRHAGLTPQLECWDDCFAGWTYFMASIQAYAETRIGTPFVA